MSRTFFATKMINEVANRHDCTTGWINSIKNTVMKRRIIKYVILSAVFAAVVALLDVWQNRF